MSTSSPNQTPKPADQRTAWAYTLANLVTIPGLGSIAAGHRIGYVQVGISLVGFTLSFGGMGSFVREWFSSGEYPEGFRPSLLVALAGMVLFGTAWLWAFRTSVKLHRKKGNALNAPPRLSASEPARPAPPPR